MSATTSATQQQSGTATSAAAGSSTTLATLTSASPSSVTPVALTTTFTPPPACTEHRLTLLSSPGYFMWLNEPIPVPGTTFGDCYPPQYMSGYTSVFNASSSIAPLFSPLVCPQAWSTVNIFESNYIACCPSGFLFHPPSTTIDTDRPAYGGTCYSSFTVGNTVVVTAYDNTTVTATQQWVASSTADQAYAHVLDGFALPQESSRTLSGGAIAGIVIGVLAFVALILALAFFFLRRRRQRLAAASKPADHDPRHEADPAITYHEATGGDEAFRKELPAGNGAAAVAELESPRGHELDTTRPAELDGGWRGAEVDTPPGTGTGKGGEGEGKTGERGAGTGTGTGSGEEPRTPPPAY